MKQSIVFPAGSFKSRETLRKQNHWSGEILNSQPKLKENTVSILLGAIAGLFIVTIMIVATRQLNGEMANRVTGGIWVLYAIIGIIVWLRTRNWGYFIWIFTCVAIALSYFTDYKGPYFFVPAAALLMVYAYFLITKRLRWRYRDILELAAKPVNETADGFTARPLPVGTAHYTKEEIIHFGKYLSKNLIAFPFIEKNRIYLMINSSGIFFYRKPKIQKDTFISFDMGGNISVNIAKKDYKKYRTELTFDQLCKSLGNLFKTYLNLYQEGEQDRIIPMIDRHLSGLRNAGG